MNNNKFKLIYIILIFKSVIGKRISELKCDEIKSLNTDLPSINPHLMEIQIPHSNTSRYCTATLISKDFVLTSASCLTVYFRTTTNSEYISSLRIRKLTYSKENNSNFTHSYRVKRIVRHELYARRPGLYDIALLQLDEEILFRNTLRIFRPACLWSHTNDSFDTYKLYGHVKDDKFLHLVSAGISTEKCLEDAHWISKFPNYSIPTVMCINTTLRLTKGSPVEINISNQTYVYGIIATSNPFYRNIYGYSVGMYDFGPKISYFIEWIESIVWPDISELPRRTEMKSNKECGQRKINHRPLMSNAERSFHGEFPWHIALYRNNREYICGGTILNNRSVLTAAHCVHDERGILPPNRLTVLAGTHKLNEYPIEAEIYTVKEIIVHENYNHIYLENDIALLRLNLLITFSNYIQPICISNTLEYNNITMGVVAGWGRDEYNRQSDILLQATLPVIDHFKCRASNRDFFPIFLNDHNYCAGYDNGTSVCSGDSGGGMIVEYESHWYLRGIVSLGIATTDLNRCDLTALILFTNVPKFYNWIVTQLDDNQ